ncbi:MAG: hypothetical protein GY861_22705 [bacterium]|nr:hypothetical protein [bacterium]
MGDYILPETALTGYGQTGPMVCGVLGCYTNVPSNTLPGNPSFPSEPNIPIYVKIKNTYVYPLKGTLSWSYSLSSSSVSNCSFEIACDYPSKPDMFETVKIWIGTTSSVLWLGMITSMTETYIGGSESEGNRTFKYQIDCVDYAHLLTRRYVKRNYKKQYSNSIIKGILNSKLSNRLAIGNIHAGNYYSAINFDYEQCSGVIEQLASDSEYICYVDERKRLNFHSSGITPAPFTVGSNWTYSGTWDFPINNYSNLSIKDEGSQVVTKANIYGSRLKRRYVTAKYIEEIPEDVDVPWQYTENAATKKKGGAYPIAPGQKVFYTEHRIFRINRLTAVWVKYKPNFEDPTALDMTWKYHTWYEPERYISSKMTQFEVADRYYSPNELEGDPEWEWNYHNNAIAWELPADESGRTEFYGEGEEVDEEDAVFGSDAEIEESTEPPFDWQVSYGGNSVTFNGTNTVIGQDEGNIEFKHIYIDYYQRLNKTYSYTNSSSYVYQYRDGSDGVFEYNREERGVMNKADASRIARSLFEQRAGPAVSISYTTYIRGKDIVSKRIRAGMRQQVDDRGRSLQMIVSSANYSLVSGNPVVFKVDVNLSSKTKSLSGLIKRLLSRG